MRLFKKLWSYIDAIQFRIVLGFWKSDLKKLFIVMMSRDDEEWVHLYATPTKTEFSKPLPYNIKNNVVQHRNHPYNIVGVGGNYEDGSNLNILYGDMTENEIVLMADHWKKIYISGPWQAVIKLLIQEVVKK